MEMPFVLPPRRSSREGEDGFLPGSIHVTLYFFTSREASQEGDRVGLVPINYVRIMGRKSESPPLREPIDQISKFEAAFRNVK
ncbi:hypothetical protein OESDEN_05435 [Oesophagostomum dentatum]|uniref:Uncharacterized protein n=1 Tax=Oesophagostomum dentatum TaxID=61180 RepID=A0A0B1TAT6_OESDE|nr:hypothetical protein OESDEN_05435 [Oesophagostomum dentatum]